MRSILNISDAAAIALHTADYLECQEQPLSQALQIAKALGVSYNHLSKVLQNLTKAGLVQTTRGPKGGFALTTSGKRSKVRDFISAVDGRPAPKACLLKHKACMHANCMFGNFLSETNDRFEAVLNRRISEFSKRK